MKQPLMVMVLLFLLAIPFSTSSSSEMDFVSSDEQKLITITTTIAGSYDSGYLNKALHEDFVGINFKGEKLFKSEYISLRKGPFNEVPGAKLEKVNYDEYQVRNLGSFAFVNFRRRYEGFFQGKEIWNFSRSTYVFIRAGTDWKLISSQITSVQ